MWRELKCHKKIMKNINGHYGFIKIQMNINVIKSFAIAFKEDGLSSGLKL